MKSPQERLNERLEQLTTSAKSDEYLASGFLLPTDQEDLEIDNLVAMARRLQTASQLQVSADFADMLERRMHRHHLEQKRKNMLIWSLSRILHLHPALATTVSLCLLFFFLGTGVLTMAAQVTSPDNLLYGLKQWEQHVQYTLASSPADQAELVLQFARDSLKTLSSLTGQADTDNYLQTLSSFDQQLSMATRAINALPAGSERTELASELGTLEQNAHQELRAFLPDLTISESVATTTELGHLGDSIPQITSATLTLPTHPNGLATISIVGSGIQPGAHLLVDGRQIQVTGTVPNGQIAFSLNWDGNWHPRSLGILNPDGTATQTSSILLNTSNDRSSNSGKSDGGNNGDRNGNNSGKPEKTPTPRHS